MRELFASVDLGGTKIAAAIAVTSGEIVAEGRIATDSHEGPSAVLVRMAALVSDLSGRAGAQPMALGMGVPGLADVRTGVTRFLPNLAMAGRAGWRDANQSARLSRVSAQ